MKVVYRIALLYRSEQHLIAALRRTGISFRDTEPQDGVLVVEIDEEDPLWPRIASIDGLSPDPSTRFTSEDLANADYVALTAEWMNGYPEPSNDGGWRKGTYDVTKYCRVCGVRGEQIAPFRLAKPPKWGRRSIFELNWIGDAHFVRPEVWKSRFEPFGISCKPVVLNRSGETLENVVQLDVATLATLDMSDPRLRDVSGEECRVCGNVRYNYIRRGYVARPIAPKAHIFKSEQYFGSGHKADRLVYVSNELYRAIADLRGVTFQGCLPAFPEFSPTPR